MNMHRTVQKYKYFIAAGNNSQVVKRCMDLRDDRWEETTASDKLYNFRWQPWGRLIDYKSVNSFGVRQLVNHLQGHEFLSTKHLLFESMTSFCEAKKMDVFKMLPLTFSLELQHDGSQEELQKFLSVFNLLDKGSGLEEVN